jgi:hypothetical protein
MYLKIDNIVMQDQLEDVYRVGRRAERLGLTDTGVGVGGAEAAGTSSSSPESSAALLSSSEIPGGARSDASVALSTVVQSSETVRSVSPMKNQESSVFDLWNAIQGEIHTQNKTGKQRPRTPTSECLPTFIGLGPRSLRPPT